jgi:dimethylglycine catabolism A
MLVSNNRKDKYGGNFSKRMYLIKKVLSGIRKVCGKNYPIGIRIDADEFIVGGSTLKHATRVAEELAKEKVAYIGISVGGELQDAWHAPAYMTDGVSVHLAEKIKKAVSKYKTPIVTAGKIPNAHFAESILQNNEADIIGICRAILCDNEWPLKSKEGRFDEIESCEYCNQCMDNPKFTKPITCIKRKNKKTQNNYRKGNIS